MRMTRTAAILAATLLAVAPAAGARGHHKSRRVLHGGHGGSIHGSGAFAGDRRHGSDAYVQSASEEEDKLLDTKIKSICRGC